MNNTQSPDNIENDILSKIKKYQSTNPAYDPFSDYTYKKGDTIQYRQSSFGTTCLIFRSDSKNPQLPFCGYQSTHSRKSINYDNDPSANFTVEEIFYKNGKINGPYAQGLIATDKNDITEISKDIKHYLSGKSLDGYYKIGEYNNNIFTGFSLDTGKSFHLINQNENKDIVHISINKQGPHFIIKEKNNNKIIVSKAYSSFSKQSNQKQTLEQFASDYINNNLKNQNLLYSLSNDSSGFENLPNGDKMTFHHKNGKKEGPFEITSSNGDKTIGTYSQGQKTGISKIYNRQGKLIGEKDEDKFHEKISFLRQKVKDKKPNSVEKITRKLYKGYKLLKKRLNKINS